MQITESAQNSKMEKVEQEHFFTAILNGAVKYLKAIQKFRYIGEASPTKTMALVYIKYRIKHDDQCFISREDGEFIAQAILSAKKT